MQIALGRESDGVKVCSFALYMSLKKQFGFTLILFMLPVLVGAQLANEQSALNKIAKGKWTRAKVLLIKALNRDSLNTAAHYGLSVYFFTPANPVFHIDSAYEYATRALFNFWYTSLKQRERLRKIPLDSMVLIGHRADIDSAAFERAKAFNTEVGYNDFITRFEFASQHALAIELRDEVAYLDALKENTYASYLSYLEKYPGASRSAEAKARYDRLLYEDKAKSGKLLSYEAFLHDYPTTPYRNEVEKQIFEISTASGEPIAFKKFLTKYARSVKAVVARNLLYHLLKDDEVLIPAEVLNDSIRNMQELEKYILVPFFKNGSYGFMNEHGKEIIKPVFVEMPDEYLCGDITDKLIVVGNRILARNGTVLFRGVIQKIEDIGGGFIKVITPECVKVIHYSGFNLGEDCFQNAKLLGKNYIALQKANQWSVWTFAGRKLIDYEWDDIQTHNDVVIFVESKEYSLVRLVNIATAADKNAIEFSQRYDEVKKWATGLLWVRSGKVESVLDQNLKPWVKAANQKIVQSFFGAISQTSLGWKLHASPLRASQTFFRVKINEPWVTVQQDGYWHLIDPLNQQFQSPAFDSIDFTGPFSVGVKNDSIYVYLTKGKSLKLFQTTKVLFIPGKDSLSYLMIEDHNEKIIYDRDAQLLFRVTCDRIMYNNEGFFTIAEKNKYGIISYNGNLKLPAIYDAVGSINHGVVQTLKDKKFGLVSLTLGKEILPDFDRNLVRYHATAIIASQNGLFGLIDWNSKSITPFEFEEVQYWNDSSVLVKKNFRWIIYNFVEKKVIMDKIKTFKWVRVTDQEKILIVQQENKYGVISNKRGTIIPPTFTDIINLGSESVPLYFTEKHVEEASIFVVIYYDKNGKQLRKQVYETDDYEKIYCSDN